MHNIRRITAVFCAHLKEEKINANNTIYKFIYKILGIDHQNLEKSKVMGVVYIPGLFCIDMCFSPCYFADFYGICYKYVSLLIAYSNLRGI